MAECHELPSRVDERGEGLLVFSDNLIATVIKSGRGAGPKKPANLPDPGKVESPSDESLKDDAVTDSKTGPSP